jgi:hypothetical protein
MTTITEHKPRVDNICTDDWEWMEVSKLLDMPSCDFGFEPLRQHKEMKRRDEHYARLVKDLHDQGFLSPVLVDKYEGVDHLGNGHHRVVAAYDLGLTHVPVTRNQDVGWEMVESYEGEWEH